MAWPIKNGTLLATGSAKNAPSQEVENIGVAGTVFPEFHLQLLSLVAFGLKALEFKILSVPVYGQGWPCDTVLVDES